MKRPEDIHQKAVVEFLRWHRVFFCAIRNDGQVGGLLWALGIERGMPDLMIFDRPPLYLHSPGAALEMKHPRSRTKKEHLARQKAKLVMLKERGWQTRLCQSSQDAIGWLKGLGYGC